jgi:hypothetical protein
MVRYFLAAAPHDHVLIGVSTRSCHAPAGKGALLSQMTEGDWLAYYSSRERHGKAIPCRRFTAIGRVAAGRVSVSGASEGLDGLHRPMRYLRCYPLPAAGLVGSLSFVRNPKRWGPSFRPGLFEVQREDFAVIARAMLTRVDWETL